jgi:hypothetical protein
MTVRNPHRIWFSIVALLAFWTGSVVDSSLRRNQGMNCFGCTTFACKIVTVADNPQLFISHPVEVTKELLTIND